MEAVHLVEEGKAVAKEEAVKAVVVKAVVVKGMAAVAKGKVEVVKGGAVAGGAAMAELEMKGDWEGMVEDLGKTAEVTAGVLVECMEVQMERVEQAAAAVEI